VQCGAVTIVHPQFKPLLPLWVEGLWTNLRMCVVTTSQYIDMCFKYLKTLQLSPEAILRLLP